MQLQGKKINFLGDSITEGVNVEPVELRFTDEIARITGAVCRNYGIAGTRIARQTKPSEEPSHDLDFCMRALKMDPDADLVVVFGGTNDYGHGDAPFGCSEDRTVATFCGALHVLYQSLLLRYPEAQIAVLTPLHRLNEESPYGEVGKEKPEPGPVLREYVAQIRKTAEYYALPVLDLYAVSGLQPSVPTVCERYIPDGLHPNAAGHALLVNRMIHFFEQL